MYPNRNSRLVQLWITGSRWITNDVTQSSLIIYSVQNVQEFIKRALGHAWDFEFAKVGTDQIKCITFMLNSARLLKFKITTILDK
jgi:hypothetical protein